MKGLLAYFLLFFVIAFIAMWAISAYCGVRPYDWSDSMSGLYSLCLILDGAFSFAAVSYLSIKRNWD